MKKIFVSLAITTLIFCVVVIGFLGKNAHKDEINTKTSMPSTVKNQKPKDNEGDDKDETSLKDENNKKEEPKNEEIRRIYKLNVKTQAQEKWFYCAPTTVSMILNYRGMNVSQHKLAADMGTYEPFGTHNKDAIRIMNRYLFGKDFPLSGESGYRIEEVRAKTPESIELFKKRLAQNIKDGYPMYYTVDLAKLYPGRSNPAEHNVVGSGYVTSANGKDIESVYIVDPYSKFHENGSGEKIVSVNHLFEAMTSPTVTEPNYAW